MRLLFRSAAPLALALATALPAAATTPPAPVEQAPIDPARMALARTTVDAVFPEGTYAKLMNGALNGMMGKIMDGVGQMPLRDLAAMSGKTADDLQKLGKTNLNDIMAIYDPAFKERMNVSMGVIMPAMIKMMGEFEPGMRDGLTEAYARKFTPEQLADMNRFFATPSGQAYAANAMLIQMDPAVLDRMMGAMPKMLGNLMKEMPALEKQIKEETAKLPQPRSYKDLSPAERKKLADLLGITETQLAAQEAKKAAKK